LTNIGDPIDPDFSVFSAPADPSTVPLHYRRHAHERRLLFLVNPFGGTGLAPAVWQGVALPMLRAANARFSCTLTTHAGHAGEIAAAISCAAERARQKQQLHLEPSEKKQPAEAAPAADSNNHGNGNDNGNGNADADSTDVDAIVCVSGDGLFHEVMNGLASAAHGGGPIGLRFPVGLIPAGSANGVAHSGTVPGLRSSEYRRILQFALDDCDHVFNIIHCFAHTHTQDAFSNRVAAIL
jgi:hypothetical protein